MSSSATTSQSNGCDKCCAEHLVYCSVVEWSSLWWTARKESVRDTIKLRGGVDVNAAAKSHFQNENESSDPLKSFSNQSGRNSTVNQYKP